MNVPRRGGEAAMAEQNLDGAQVGPGFEQMGGETVAQRVHDDVFAQAGRLAGAVADFAYARGGDGPVGEGAGKEDVAWSRGFPIGAEDLEQPGGEHDIA